MISQRARGELFWVGLGQGGTMVLGLLTLKLLTNLLGPDEYGTFVLALSLAGLLNLFFYGPLAQAVSRYLHVSVDTDRMAEFVAVKTLMLRWSIWVAVLLGVVVLTILSLLNLTAWSLVALLALAYGLCAGILAVELADYNTRRQRRAYALLQTGDAVLRLLLAAAIIYFLGDQAHWALAGFLCGSLIFAVLARRGLQDQQASPGLESQALPPSSPPSTPTLTPQVSTGLPIKSGFMRYAASFSLFALPAAAAAYGDRWLIQQTLTAADVGVYVALTQIANAPANLLQAVFSQLMNPILFQRAGAASSPEAVRASQRMLYRTLLVLLLLLLAVVAVSVLFAEEIVVLMTSAAFANQAHLLWLLVVAAAVFQLGQGLAAEAFIHNRPFSLFFPKMAHALVFLGGALMLVQSMQLAGVALAAIVAASVYLALVVFSNARAASARSVAP